MKQVIFIFLLTISLCLSAPPKDTPTDATKHQEAPPPTEKNVTPEANLPAQGAEITPAPQGSGPSAPPQINATTDPNASPKDTNHTISPVPTKNATEKANTTTEKVPATPSDNSSIVPTSTQRSADIVPTTVSTTTKATPSTEPEHKATVPPKTPEPIPVHARGFDGASFVGGIILTLGLLAIGFMGFKYYKNQTERNYHTL